MVSFTCYLDAHTHGPNDRGIRLPPTIHILRYQFFTGHYFLSFGIQKKKLNRIRWDNIFFFSLLFYIRNDSQISLYILFIKMCLDFVKFKQTSVLVYLSRNHFLVDIRKKNYIIQYSNPFTQILEIC